MTQEERAHAIELLQRLLREDEEEKKAAESKQEEETYRPPEMISIDEARRRTNLSRSALLTIFAERPETYIKNGRRYFVNWNNLAKVLNGGMTMMREGARNGKQGGNH